MDRQTFDLVVIGGGPGGYVAAIRAAQLGLQVACIEKEKALGGTCLRVGCIPSKALLQSSHLFEQACHGLAEHGVQTSDVRLDLPAMMKRKDRVVRGLTGGVGSLLKKNKIERFAGLGSFAGQTQDGSWLVDVHAPGAQKTDADKITQIIAKKAIVATGSEPIALPGLDWVPGRIGSSTDALAYSEVPKHLVVIGAGVIGLELGSVWRRLGSEVTVVEYGDGILPGMDRELAKAAQKLFQKQGLKFLLNKKVVGAKADGDMCRVEIEGGEPIEGDQVLVAVGRKAHTQGLGLEHTQVVCDRRGRIEVDAHFATASKGIFAIGDVIPGPMLAHKAEEDGVACVEAMVTGYGHVDYNGVAGVVYTEPEIATVGQSEEALKEAGVAYRKGSFPLMANGRAKAAGHTDGFVKILADATTDRILGVHILGAQSSELIAEATAAMAYGASSEDLARVCHAHPTLSEAIKEAALAVDGRAIHF